VLSLKKDRQCGMQPYPTYPTQGMPGMMGPMPTMPMMPGMTGMTGMPSGFMQPGMQNIPGYGGTPSTSMPSTPSTSQGVENINQQLSRMQQQINMLDRRVSQLEASFSEIKTVPYNTGTKYNDSSYHMM